MFFFLFQSIDESCHLSQPNTLMLRLLLPLVLTAALLHPRRTQELAMTDHGFHEQRILHFWGHGVFTIGLLLLLRVLLLLLVLLLMLVLLVLLLRLLLTL